MRTQGRELPGAVALLTTPIPVLESQRAATMSMRGRTVLYTALTGNPETGPRTPAADGNRPASPNPACSSSSKHERSANSALRTSVVHGLVDFGVEAAAEGRFQVWARRRDLAVPQLSNRVVQGNHHAIAGGEANSSCPARIL